MGNKTLEIDKQLFWFNFFKALPYFLMACTVIVFFILGIVDAVNEIWFEIRSGFSIWFFWMVIGIFGSLIVFAVSRILMSPKLLQVYFLHQIYYLQKCAGEKDKLVLKEEIVVPQDQKDEVK